MDIGYTRVSTTKQDLDRQVDALRREGIAAGRIYVDKKSGANTNRRGLHAVLDQAREGDVIVVHTLDRLGRTMRDTLNLIYDLADRGVWVRNLADPIKVDSSNPEDPMSQLAVVMLACSGRWNAPTPSNPPPTPAPWPLPRAGGSASPAWSIPPNWPTPRTCATRSTPSPRSSRKPAIGVAGAFGIFATNRALRRLGSVAMSAGLAVFGLITLHTALNHALAESPALPIIWILSVAAAITVSWLTLFFYRDLDLYDVEEGYLADSE
ncbi:recombinase family protein [Micrococcus terreus]|uniref:Resolvase, N terminal domain n=1 Tax=Micrococcus terreus TaxID=574650 RepID=A0A1I7MSR1_9MICC|nr:recombinase family protein [Micrococcus terreus]SFV24889.1 Resolvase, N terminal domain [Micrococcus terreus]